MNWSWTPISIAGIPLRLHWSLLLFLPFAAWVMTTNMGQLAQVLSLAPDSIHMPHWVWGIILAGGVLLAILLHELAHCAMAAAWGARTRSITLMLLGGVSMIEGHDLKPSRMLTVALAGPVASFVLAVWSFALALLFHLSGGAADLVVASVTFGALNTMLGVFNLLPAYPMDGGQVLRSALAMVTDPLRADRLAARSGRVMAALFAGLAIVTFHPILLLIAVFVWIGAGRTLAFADLQEVLRAVSAREVMVRDLHTVPADMPLSEVERVLRMERGRMVRVSPPAGSDPRAVGILFREQVDGVPPDANPPAASLAMHTLPTVGPTADGMDILKTLMSRKAPAVLVTDAVGALLGVVDLPALEEGRRLARVRQSA